MKAIVQDAYGPPAQVLHLEEVDRPELGDRDVLIRVRAAGVNPLDWHFVTGKPYVARMAMGRSRPKVRLRGAEVAGEVEAVGKDVKTLRAGDGVFGWCDGGFAEYTSGLEDHFLVRPATATYEESAAVPVAAITALQGLRNFGKLQSGQRALINGASGGVGTYAVQIGKALGAEVTGVCSSRNVELVRSIGADNVIDYTSADFTKNVARYDLVLDNAGNHSISALRGTLKPGGILVYNSGASMPRMGLAMLQSRLGRKVVTFLANMNRDDFGLIKTLMESGKVRSVIDRTYPLSEAPAAVAYVEAGHARGKVVVTV
jgi:NADPH:quinone reductase-like Zn-dependent oxidoreductase